MGKHARRMVAVIPAHNEQDNVGHTVASLKDQTIPPDKVLVVSDNSTDHTVQAARGAGADTMVTTGNTHKKAGALNQALATLNLTSDDLVLIMDADTIMTPGWIERALVELQDPRVGAVGAVFQADSDRGWLRGCQAREWHRYGVQIARTGKTFVLSGTAALIRWEALQDVTALRSHAMYTADTIRRFWAKVERRGPNECWGWNASTHKDGYPSFYVPNPGGHNRQKLGHRFMVELQEGRELSKDEYVLHSCDNPTCTNPRHLRIGTQKDNVRDCMNRGRMNRAKGERTANAKMNDETIRSIRLNYTGAYGEAAHLAREYGVTKSVMARILSGGAWQHLDVPKAPNYRKQVRYSGTEVMPSVSGPYDTNALTED